MTYTTKIIIAIILQAVVRLASNFESIQKRFTGIERWACLRVAN